VTLVEQVLLFLVILGGLLAVAAVVSFLVARRVIRRRWHGVANHVATKGVLTTVSVLAAWRERAGARVRPESVSRGTAARARRRLWVAIEDAEAAVQHADASHAPVGELPAVCRSLRGVAGQLDTLLRLERRLPMDVAARPEGVRAQVADVITAARDVQSAALHASSDANAPRISALIRDAGNEVEMVAAAVARMRSISPS
jgi:hypothetical protein